MKCYFCKSDKDIILPKISIALSMGGDDYSFCKKCLKMPAFKFWQKMFESLGYTWPPELIKGR
jgi:hypothetical protein